LPPAQGRALRDVMLMFTMFLLRWGLSLRDKDVRAGDVGEFVCFFPNVRRARVTVNLNTLSWDCTFVEKVKLEESFVDLLLRHIVLMLSKLAAAKYHVASTTTRNGVRIDRDFAEICCYQHHNRYFALFCSRIVVINNCNMYVSIAIVVQQIKSRNLMFLVYFNYFICLI
jgi:hypothetical protein